MPHFPGEVWFACFPRRDGEGLNSCGQKRNDLCHLLLTQSPCTKIYQGNSEELFPKQALQEIQLGATSVAGLSWELGQPWDLAWLRVPVPWSVRLRGALRFSWAPWGGEKHCRIASLSSFVLPMSSFSCCFSLLPSPLSLLTGMISYTNQFSWIYQQLSCFYFLLKANNRHILMFH